jgi:hypothetical protein
METRGAKRTKLQTEEEEEYRESSNDPLIKVCSDLLELILKHFNGHEVLELSLISPDWNETIQTSRKCMSKIQLKLEGNVSEAKLTLMKSNRKYSSLLIRSAEESQPIDVYELLEKFAPNLVNITIPAIEKLKVTASPKTIDFPKLQSFASDNNENNDLRLLAPIPMLKYFEKVKTLKKLKIVTWTHSKETLDWIQKQTQLKELNLSARSDEDFETDFLVNSKFMLTKLECCGPETDAGKANFNKFLLGMAETLTFLSITFCPPQCFEIIINRLPKLKTFHCDLIHKISKLDFAPNESITELKLRCLDASATNLFKSLVNLEVLKTNRIIKSDFKCVVRKMKMKKFVYSQYNSRFVGSESVFKKISELYNRLKETDEQINRDIELELVAIG